MMEGGLPQAEAALVVQSLNFPTGEIRGQGWQTGQVRISKSDMEISSPGLSLSMLVNRDFDRKKSLQARSAQTGPSDSTMLMHWVGKFEQTCSDHTTTRETRTPCEPQILETITDKPHVPRRLGPTRHHSP
jgi:hypothetical protein